MLVDGPAGSGKTSLVAAWRRELLALGFDVAWLTLASDDNDVSRWLDYLLASFSQVDPTISDTASQLVGRGVDSEAVDQHATMPPCLDQLRDQVVSRQQAAGLARRKQLCRDDRLKGLG
ncbi:hypothetical protein FNJ47_06940 [Bradyrhizobium sp. UFLA 03-164]|uniref:Uncharacterized protein n=1 Tax=Bradyrhizobium uaiense TaxID=2594946 RepID=A0A6P1BD39_9BRAD|nr:hypothetical protein [Bradyrhizobium uaiense]